MPYLPGCAATLAAAGCLPPRLFRAACLKLLHTIHAQPATLQERARAHLKVCSLGSAQPPAGLLDSVQQLPEACPASVQLSRMRAKALFVLLALAAALPACLARHTYAEIRTDRRSLILVARVSWWQLLGLSRTCWGPHPLLWAMCELYGDLETRWMPAAGRHHLPPPAATVETPCHCRLRPLRAALWLWRGRAHEHLGVQLQAVEGGLRQGRRLSQVRGTAGRLIVWRRFGCRRRRSSCTTPPRPHRSAPATTQPDLGAALQGRLLHHHPRRGAPAGGGPGQLAAAVGALSAGCRGGGTGESSRRPTFLLAGPVGAAGRLPAAVSGAAEGAQRALSASSGRLPALPTVLSQPGLNPLPCPLRPQLPAGRAVRPDARGPGAHALHL